MDDKDLDEDVSAVGAEEAEEAAETGTGKGDRKRLVAIIAAVVVVVLVAAGVGGWLAWSKHELDVAKADCASAAESVGSVKAGYAKLVAGDAKTASGITVEQVKDGKTVENLATELKASEPEVVDCPVKDVKGLKDATVKLGEQTDWYKTHKESLNKAVENVNQSKLDKIIDDATTLLNDSDGKVQDNAVRDDLSKAIEGRDERAIGEAVARVNDSVAAKTRADEEARAQAEAEAQAAAEAAAAQAQSYTPAYTNTGYSGYSGYTSGGNSGSSSSSGSGGGSTSSTPQTNTQSNDNEGHWWVTGDYEMHDGWVGCSVDISINGDSCAGGYGWSLN
ncbi:colicin transporter [Bifidobacterium sp. DSM 109963]|uniref:Colicin transporter n=2 Tax=Bifidobacterium panos TaxID=2675321 RepID=A0ABX1SXF6_9BIFI|nr:colicin transporter [Bifidobacterium sp. DSM 109963]